MKKLLIALAAALVTVASYGQGQVVFGNLGGGVNAPVMYGDTGHGPGPDYTAQLYLQSGATLTPLEPSTVFRAAGTGAQAVADRYLTTKTVDVPGVTPGNPGTFVIRAWKTSLGSYDAAFATKADYGFSTPVTVNVGGGQLPAANLTGLQGFTVIAIPEPSIIALGVLGASALLLRRRK
jgi:hypothetical protein